MVSANSVAQAITSLLVLTGAPIVYYKRPNHPLLWISIACFALCAGSVLMYHLCASPDIEWCAQSTDTELTMDTFGTYLAVAVTFAPFMPLPWAAPYMGFMILFCWFLTQTLYDSFWSIFVIVPVAGFPMFLDGQAQEVVRHPLVNWLHYFSIVLGLVGVYCKYEAGTDASSSTYATFHPLWHTFVALASAVFMCNQKRVLKAETIEYAQVPSTLKEVVRDVPRQFLRD